MTAELEAITREELNTLLQSAGIKDESNLTALHLTEIEEEIGNLFDLLTAFRVHARHHEIDAAQDVLVEVSTALFHLQGHVQSVLPLLDKQLGIGDDDDDEEDNGVERAA